MQAVFILGGAFLVIVLMTFFPFVRDWWKSFFSNKGQALLLGLAMMAMFLGVSASIDPTSLSGDLPSSRRLIRAVVFSGLFLLSVLSIIGDPKRFRLAGKPVQIMLFYGLIATASAIYSIGPFISLWKGFEVTTLVLIVISLAGRIREPGDLRHLLNSLNLISMFLVLTVLVGLALYPQEALHSSVSSGQQISYLGVRGLVPVINPATQGAFAAILFITALSYLLTPEKSVRKNLIGLWLVIIISCVLIILAHSRTQIFAACAAALILVFYSRRYLLGLVIISFGSIAFIATSETVLTYIYRGQTEEQFITMTGRTKHWENVWAYVSDSFMLGKGFYAAQRITFGSGSVDNTYLECFIGLGLVGLVALISPIILASLYFFKVRPRSRHFTNLDTLWITFAGIFTILVTRSITSPTFASMHPMLLYHLITLLAVSALVRFHFDRKQTARVSHPEPEQALNNIDNPARNTLKILRKRRNVV